MRDRGLARDRLPPSRGHLPHCRGYAPESSGGRRRSLSRTACVASRRTRRGGPRHVGQPLSRNERTARSARGVRYLCYALSEHAAVHFGHAQLCGRARQGGGFDALSACPRAARGRRRGTGRATLSRSDRQRDQPFAGRPAAAIRAATARLCSRPRDYLAPFRRQLGKAHRKSGRQAGAGRPGNTHAEPRRRSGHERCDRHAAALGRHRSGPAAWLLPRRQRPRADVDECRRRNRTEGARALVAGLCLVHPACVESRGQGVPQFHAF